MSNHVFIFVFQQIDTVFNIALWNFSNYNFDIMIIRKNVLHVVFETYINEILIEIFILNSVSFSFYYI